MQEGLSAILSTKGVFYCLVTPEIPWSQRSAYLCTRSDSGVGKFIVCGFMNISTGISLCTHDFSLFIPFRDIVGRLAWWCTCVIRLRQKDLEFKFSLGHIMNWRLAWDIKWDSITNQHNMKMKNRNLGCGSVVKCLLSCIKPSTVYTGFCDPCCQAVLRKWTRGSGIQSYA